MKNKGITLIALIVTVIILLIFASVSITVLTGENGILEKAKLSSEENIKAEIKEIIELKIQEIRTQKSIDGEQFQKEDLQELTEIDVSIISFDFPIQAYYENYLIEISDNYKVKVLNKITNVPSGSATLITQASYLNLGDKAEIKVIGTIDNAQIINIESLGDAVLKTDVSQNEKIFQVSKNGKYIFKISSSVGTDVNVSIDINIFLDGEVLQYPLLTSAGVMNYRKLDQDNNYTYKYIPEKTVTATDSLIKAAYDNNLSTRAEFDRDNTFGTNIAIRYINIDSSMQNKTCNATVYVSYRMVAFFYDASNQIIKKTSINKTGESIGGVDETIIVPQNSNANISLSIPQGTNKIGFYRYYCNGISAIVEIKP